MKNTCIFFPCLSTRMFPRGSKPIRPSMTSWLMLCWPKLFRPFETTSDACVCPVVTVCVISRLSYVKFRGKKDLFDRMDKLFSKEGNCL